MRRWKRVDIQPNYDKNHSQGEVIITPQDNSNLPKTEESGSGCTCTILYQTDKLVISQR